MLGYRLRGTGETIVFLHGALVDQAMWDSQAEYFKERYQVLTVDLPEHGESAVTVLNPYRVETIAEAVMELLDALQIERFHLCGHSLGGMAAQEIALLHPKRVRRLVLAETSYGTGGTMLEKLGTASARVLMRLMTQKQFVRMSANTYGRLHETVKLYIESAMSAYTMKQCRRVMDAAFCFQSKNRLPAIENRTLILLAGENKQTRRQGMAMQRMIPNAELAVIPSACHLLNIDRPAAFNEALGAFIGLR